MNIYHLICNTVNVKPRKCFSRNNESRDKEERSKGTNGCTRNRIRECKEYNVYMHKSRGTSKTCKAFGISLPKFKFYSTSSCSQAWSKGKNLLILLSLFFTPFIVNNLTYFMLLDFSVIGYDIQSFSNLGVYR